MIWTADEASNCYNLLLHKKYEAILKQQRVHSWLSRQKRFASILPIIGDALSFLFGTSTSRDITETIKNILNSLRLLMIQFKRQPLCKNQLLGLTRIRQSNTGIFWGGGTYYLSWKGMQLNLIVSLIRFINFCFKVLSLYNKSYYYFTNKSFQ